MFKGKKIIIFGERDEIQGASIENCLKAAGVKEENIISSITECFV
ncbi:MAG: hypothetical protein HYV47_01420 [Candidatus Nealsonbacteria bacterium]|nr:hypothetical protein [Candidatus Nealsonbacteria bacterium]